MVYRDRRGCNWQGEDVSTETSKKFLNDFENRCDPEVCGNPGKVSPTVSASFASGGGVTTRYDRVLTKIRLADKLEPGSRQGREVVLTFFGFKKGKG